MKTRRTIPSHFVLLPILFCIASGCSPPAHDPPHPDTAGLLSQFDPEHPGYGTMKSTGRLEHDPMAYGLYASCANLLGSIDDARIAADWLVDNTSSPTSAGWGLPHAWDAFGDGTVNPESTVYAITTAIIVRGLLDTYESTHDQRYLNAARDALAYYSDFFIETEHGGYFAYSDQTTDQLEVHNATAAIMGQYARMHAYFPEDKFDELASKAMNQLDSKSRTYQHGIFWNYHAHVDRPNDLIHACHVLLGRLEYREYLDQTRDLTADLNYLKQFQDTSAIRKFADHRNLNDRQSTMSATPDAIGLLAFVHAYAGDTASWELAIAHLEPQRYSTDADSSPPQPDNFHPRRAGFTALGLCVIGSVD